MNLDPRHYEARSDLLTDRIIMITGAGDGIGSQAARTCAAHGATVILVGRTQAKLQAVHDAIVGDGLPEPSIAAIDFASAQGDDYQTITDAVER